MTRGPKRRAGHAAKLGSKDVSPQVAKLSWADRLDILDGLSQVLEQVYVHLPLKRSLYGFDIIRALASLRQQSTSISDIQFHRELTTLMNRLRDAHTQYQGPWTQKDVVASLPFLVEAYGPADDTTYVVSKVDGRSVKDKHFTEMVEVTHWNGIPFERAVDLHADVATGGRRDSRQARALESLTFRALEYGPPPDEEWVVIDYIDLLGEPRTIRFQWDGLKPLQAPNAGQKSLATRFRRSIHMEAEAVRRAKKYRFNHALWKAERGRGGKKAKSAKAFADFLSARSVTTKSGKFGYLRIWSFDVDDDEAFIDAASSMLGKLPDRGLIIDIRNNPGGLIWAAERLLQIFTPNVVQPTKFALRATSTTAEMARAAFNRDELGPWTDSLTSAESTGEPYSAHIPITSPEQCSNIGQRYGGPVVVVCDANTYSSGDLFAAGIVDNGIGPLVCIGDATGAGGANVWSAQDIADALRPARLAPAKLPKGVDFTMSIRRAVRGGASDGALIEDAGVAGQRYDMTGTDISHGNKDLIEHCARMLAAQPWTRMNLKRVKSGIEVETVGLDQLDVFASGHPAGPPVRIVKDGKHTLKLAGGKKQLFEIVGIARGTVRQRRRIMA
jgi:hypothetical protein